MFAIVLSEHTDCIDCDAQATKAANVARVTGSISSAYSDGAHGARVRRISTSRIPVPVR